MHESDSDLGSDIEDKKDYRKGGYHPVKINDKFSQVWNEKAPYKFSSHHHLLTISALATLCRNDTTF